MAFSVDLTDKINEYIYGHLPKEEWYNENFYPFIKNVELRERLIVEFKNARVIYKIFEGLQAKGELQLAQIKTQVIMYVSIQEAVINYILFEVFNDKEEVKDLLSREQFTQIMIPRCNLEKLKKELTHCEKEIFTCFKEIKQIDKTKIRYDRKVEACYKLKLIDQKLKDDLIELYKYRNTVHLEAELKKNLNYNLEMGQLAYRRVEGLSIQLKESLKNINQ